MPHVEGEDVEAAHAIDLRPRIGPFGGWQPQLVVEKPGGHADEDHQHATDTGQQPPNTPWVVVGRPWGSWREDLICAVVDNPLVADDGGARPDDPRGVDDEALVRQGEDVVDAVTFVGCGRPGQLPGRECLVVGRPGEAAVLTRFSVPGP